MLKRVGRSRRSERKSVDWDLLREKVLRRDGGCVAPRLGAMDACSGRITLDHVKFVLMMGRKAPDDEQHLVSLCWHHHLDGWATAHRPVLRNWLIAHYGREAYGNELP